MKTIITIHKYNALTNTLIQAMALTIKFKDVMNCYFITPRTSVSKIQLAVFGYAGFCNGISAFYLVTYNWNKMLNIFFASIFFLFVVSKPHQT